MYMYIVYQDISTKYFFLNSTQMMVLAEFSYYKSSPNKGIKMQTFDSLYNQVVYKNEINHSF